MWIPRKVLIPAYFLELSTLAMWETGGRTTSVCGLLDLFLRSSTALLAVAGGVAWAFGVGGFAGRARHLGLWGFGLFEFATHGQLLI